MMPFTRGVRRKIPAAIAAIAVIGATALFGGYAGRAFVSSAGEHGSGPARSDPGAADVATAISTPPHFAMHDVPRAIPEIAFADGEGRALSLADFRGKTVLLNIWATWCGPCRKEMPTLDRLQGELGGANFEVVALSIDRAGTKVVERFYRDIAIRRLAIYIDSSAKAARDLGVVGLPTTILIDRDGRELGRLAGPAEWDAPEMIGLFKGVLAKQRGASGRAQGPGARVVERGHGPPSETPDFRAPGKGAS